MLRTAPRHLIPAHMLSAKPVEIPKDAPTFDTHELPFLAPGPVHLADYEQGRARPDED